MKRSNQQDVGAHGMRPGSVDVPTVGAQHAAPLRNTHEQSQGLPEGWVWVALDKACDVILGQSPESSTYNMEGIGLPFFQGKAEFGALYPTVVKWCSSPKKVAQKNDVLISVRAPVGPTNLAPSECCIGRGLAAIRPLTDSHYLYILYYLRSIEPILSQMGTGSTFAAITGSELKSIEVPLPPLPIQHLIVAEIEKQFSRLDEAVAALRRVQANLKRYKASVLKAAVEGRLTEEWRKHNVPSESGADLLKRILAERRRRWEEDYVKKYVGAHGHAPKDDSWKKKYKEPAAPDTAGLPELPEGWVWGTVEQINLSERPCAYGVLQPGEDLPDGVPFVRVGDIDDGRVDMTVLKRISPEIAAQYPRTKLKGGELLITLVGTIGRTAIAPATLSGANVARAVGVVPLSQDIDAYWVEIWFRNPAKVAAMTSLSHEVARKTLNLEDVRAASVAVPSLAEQHAIVAEVDRRLSVAEEIESVIETNLKRAERMRQAILKKAFKGRLV